VGALLDQEELLEHAARLVQRAAGESHGEFDLISGYAGAIAALVVLRDVLDDASLLNFAARLGEEMLKTADENGAGYSWKSVALPRQRNLTGFSHGTAGVDYALLELFRATGASESAGAQNRPSNTSATGLTAPPGTGRISGKSRHGSNVGRGPYLLPRRQ
jgi:lantibiotic modifying enzyme